MDPQTHPDPFADAASHGIQRVIEIASAVVTGTQALLYLKRDRARTQARLDERARRGQAAQLRAGQGAARASAAAIGDPRWLKNADFGQAARAWGNMLPYAGPGTPWYDPSAATVMRHAEERLRVLHPTAMARYDRLRSEGASPADAMHQAAPMFGYPPRAHDPPYTPPPHSVTAGRPDPDSGPAQAQPARASRPWQQDFPLPIGDVLAATAHEDIPVPGGAGGCAQGCSFPGDSPAQIRRTQEMRPAPMDQQTHPDPVREGIGLGMNRIVRVASSVVTAAQVLVYLSRDYVNARRENGRAAALTLAAQRRAEQTSAGVGLAAIRDPGWLEDADLDHTIQAWAAMMPYADRSLPWHHHSAAPSMRKAEERLRVLHPAAMARYDQLRSDGADPAYAMLQAALLFGNPPGAHEAGTMLQPRSLAAGGPVTSPRPDPAQAHAGAAATGSPWAQDFPLPIGEVVAATAGKDTAAPELAKTAVPAREKPREPGTGRQS